MLFILFELEVDKYGWEDNAQTNYRRSGIDFHTHYMSEIANNFNSFFVNLQKQLLQHKKII